MSLLLGLARWSYDSEHVDQRDTPRDHRRTASSHDATPRPGAALPNPGLSLPFLVASAHDGPDVDPVVSLGRHTTNTVPDPVLSTLSHQKRLGFFPSNTATHNKTSAAYPDPKAQSHSRSLADITARKEILTPNMTSAASSSAVNKGHTSPSKVSLGGVNTSIVLTSTPQPSTRTYDAKLVTREMHRLGTLAGLNPAITTSLASNASTSTLTLAPSTSPSTATLVPGTSHTHGISALTGATASDKDNPWGMLHVHVLPLFNEEPLRVPM